MKSQSILVRSTLAALVILTLFCTLPLQAQTSGSTLMGRVADSGGGGLPGVTVTATNDATGVSRSTVSSGDGTYRFALLPAGTYSVASELEGFGTVTIQQVTLNIATTRTLDITLQPAAVRDSIIVTADAPLVSTSPAIGTVVSQQELENLPLNGRQFANLASLAPGTSLGVNPDPTKPGQLVVALNGGIGRNVNYTIDGGDNTDDTIGGALQNYNLEAVQEFAIQTQQYKAEFGRSTGGVLSVVTKTGTNDLGGSIYGFFRDESLNTKTETESRLGRDKQPYERQQYGLSIGGPLVRDKAHYFLTFENTDRDTQFAVNTRGIFPELDGQSFPIPYEDVLVTGKMTFDLTASQFMQVRGGYQKYSDIYSASPLSTPDNLGTINSDYSSLLVGHQAQLGANMFNEFLVQWSDFENNILALTDSPTLIFANGVTAGQNVNTPQQTVQTKYQFKDDFSFSTTFANRRHDFKTGFNYIHEPTLGGAFSAGTSGQYIFIGNSIESGARQIQVFGGAFQFDTPVDQYSIYLQDDWSVTDKLTLNAGLRYDYWDGFDLDQRSNPIWQVLSTQTEFNEPYLRDFAGGRGGRLSNDDDNWGPRIGFTFDPAGNARHIIRGGWGIYHDFPYTNATILFPSAAVQSNYGLAYLHVDATGVKNSDGTLWRPGQPLPPSQLPASSVFPPNEVASPTLATPRATQASLGYSTELTNWLGLTLDFVSIRYRDIPFRFRANPQIDVNGNGRIDPGEPRRFPRFGNFRIWSGDGEADYDGINLGLRARAGSALELQGFYTYSEATGNVLGGADEFRITAAGHQPDLGAVADQSVDPLNPNCRRCFGPLNTDARHRVTLSAVYRTFWDINLAGVLRYRSAFPYTEWSGTDINADGYAFDLPSDVPHVNHRRGASSSQVDVRVAKEFALRDQFGIELIAEVFNLLDEENPARFVGNRRANNFEQPTVFAGDPLQGEQRLIQLGLRLRY